jgi:hypothetical protein
MKISNSITYLIILSIVLQSCSENKFSTEFADGHFWEINFPDDYRKESSKQTNSRSESEKNVLKNSGYENSSQSEKLFYYYLDDFHSISANKTILSESDKKKPYSELKSDFNKNLYKMLTKNFGNEMLLDSISSQKTISNLTFDVFKISVHIEAVNWIQETYSHSFGDEILQVKLSYLIEEEEKKLSLAMDKSKFIKK